MAKKVTKKVVKKAVVTRSKAKGFSLALIAAIVFLLMAVLLVDMVDVFLRGKRNVMMDWSKVPVEQQIDLELKNAQEAIKLDVAAFDDATLGK